MTSFDFRSLLPSALPHLISVVVMFFAASMLFSPVVFDGKLLDQGDIKNNVGMSKEARDVQRRDGEVPHWTDSMFGGMPTTQIAGTDVGTAPQWIWLAVRKAMPMEVGTVVVAMLSAYILGLCLGLSPWLALLLGLGFGLSSLNVLYLAAGHATKVRAIATMPGVVAGVMLAFRGRMWAGAGVAALFASLHLQADHVQMTYYLLFLLGAITVGAWIHGAVKGTLPQVMKTTGGLLLAGLLSALPQTGQLALTEQYAEFTTRGKANVVNVDAAGEKAPSEGLDRDYILEYSMARGEFWSIAIPDVKGGNNQLYWGEQRFSGGAFYFGALAFALCLAWLIAGTSWLRWPLLAISLLAVVLSWRDATGLTDFFLDYVPLFNKFRDTKMMLVLVQLVVPLGAAMALHEMTQPEAAKRWKRWAIGGSATAVLMLAFYAMPKVWFEFSSTIRPDLAMDQIGKRVVGMRIDVFREDVLRSFGYAMVGLIFTLALVKRWTETRWIVLGSLVILTADMLSVDGRYLSDANYVNKLDKRFPFEPTAADRVILAQEQQAIADFDEQWDAAKARWEDRLDAKLTRRYSRVIDAAAALANEEGLDAVTLTRVAETLGVRQPALYRHVDSYDDLIRSLGLRGREHLASALADTFGSELGPLGKGPVWQLPTLRNVKHGTPGGVSLMGLLGAGIGAAGIAGAGYSLLQIAFLPVLLAGILASLIDGILSASTSGRSSVTHHAVNFTACILGAVLAVSIDWVLEKGGTP